MILDPNNWDYMPPPLVDSELFNRQKVVDKTTTSELLPWQINSVKIAGKIAAV